jgi:hypothetical protein
MKCCSLPFRFFLFGNRFNCFLLKFSISSPMGLIGGCADRRVFDERNEGKEKLLAQTSLRGKRSLSFIDKLQLWQIN